MLKKVIDKLEAVFFGGIDISKSKVRKCLPSVPEFGLRGLSLYFVNCEEKNKNLTFTVQTFSNPEGEIVCPSQKTTTPSEILSLFREILTHMCENNDDSLVEAKKNEIKKKCPALFSWFDSVENCYSSSSLIVNPEGETSFLICVPYFPIGVIISDQR